MTNDLTSEMDLVLRHLKTLSDEPVNRQQLERQLKIDSSALSIILSKLVSKGYVRTIDKTEEGHSTGVLMFSLTPAGKEIATSLS